MIRYWEIRPEPTQADPKRHRLYLDGDMGDVARILVRIAGACGRPEDAPEPYHFSLPMPDADDDTLAAAENAVFEAMTAAPRRRQEQPEARLPRIKHNPAPGFVAPTAPCACSKPEQEPEHLLDGLIPPDRKSRSSEIPPQAADENQPQVQTPSAQAHFEIPSQARQEPPFTEPALSPSPFEEASPLDQTSGEQARQEPASPFEDKPEPSVNDFSSPFEDKPEPAMPDYSSGQDAREYTPQPSMRQAETDSPFEDKPEPAMQADESHPVEIHKPAPPRPPKPPKQSLPVTKAATDITEASGYTPSPVEQPQVTEQQPESASPFEDKPAPAITDFEPPQETARKPAMPQYTPEPLPETAAPATDNTEASGYTPSPLAEQPEAQVTEQQPESASPFEDKPAPAITDFEPPQEAAQMPQYTPEPLPEETAAPATDKTEASGYTPSPVEKQPETAAPATDTTEASGYTPSPIPPKQDTAAYKPEPVPPAQKAEEPKETKPAAGNTAQGPQPETNETDTPSEAGKQDELNDGDLNLGLPLLDNMFNLGPVGRSKKEAAKNVKSYGGLSDQSQTLESFTGGDQKLKRAADSFSKLEEDSELAQDTKQKTGTFFAAGENMVEATFASADEIRRRPAVTKTHGKLIGDILEEEERRQKKAEEAGEIYIPSKRLHKLGIEIPRNPVFTMENLVTRANRFAHASVSSVIDNPASMYNPFFIHGMPGTGKSHFLHAMAAELGKKFGQEKVVITDGYRLSQEIDRMIHENTIGEFEKLLDQAQALFIDDIHLLAANKGNTKRLAKWLHQFLQSDRQVVITSAFQAQNLAKLSRVLGFDLTSGGSVELKTASGETHSAVVAKMFQLAGIELDYSLINTYFTEPKASFGDAQRALRRVKILEKFKPEGYKTDYSVMLETVVGIKEVITQDIPTDEELDKIGAFENLPDASWGKAAFFCPLNDLDFIPWVANGMKLRAGELGLKGGFDMIPVGEYEPDNLLGSAYKIAEICDKEAYSSAVILGPSPLIVDAKTQADFIDVLRHLMTSRRLQTGFILHSKMRSPAAYVKLLADIMR